MFYLFRRIRHVYAPGLARTFCPAAGAGAGAAGAAEGAGFGAGAAAGAATGAALGASAFGSALGAAAGVGAIVFFWFPKKARKKVAVAERKKKRR